VAQFRYLGMTVTNHSLVQEEIKKKLNISNNMNVKNKIYKITIFPVVLYGCENWSLTLKEEHRLRVFENRVLRRIFGRKRDEVVGR
jgi:hypothetical protein